VDVYADCRQTFGDTIGNPPAGFARVLTDHGLRRGRCTHQVVPQSAADEIRALFSERKFSRCTANSVGPEQLPLLAHKRTDDDK
jgi:hypothetical protein